MNNENEIIDRMNEWSIPSQSLQTNYRIYLGFLPTKTMKLNFQTEQLYYRTFEFLPFY